MKDCRVLIVAAIIFGFVGGAGAIAGNLDTIGWTELTTREPGLNGSGVTLAQVEAGTVLQPTAWQPNPATANQPASLFTYFDVTNTYPTGALFDSGLESGHANSVANNFYDSVTGTVRSPAAIELFSANYFPSNIIGPKITIAAKIISQSYIFTNGIPDYIPTEYPDTDQDFDDYAALKNVVFVNGVANDTGSPPSPATMYNGIAVGLTTGNSSIGPTTTGRSKPDIVAPSTLTSYATPYVAGSAALLVQAGIRGDGGVGTATAATDMRTLKALLLNGAEKPPTWVPQTGEPLDRQFGAGTLNVNQSHLQLSGGKHAPTQTFSIRDNNSVTPPAGETARVNALIGWNFTTITTSQTGGFFNKKNYNGVHNYHFSVQSAAAYDLTATLVWNRQNGKSSINNLELKFYNYTTGNLVAGSTSMVDNVEHLYLQDLPTGVYVIQVVSLRAGSVTSNEDYALAFEFVAVLPPTAPGNMTVLPALATSLTINWNDNSNDESGFRILRSSDLAGPYTEVASVSAGVTTITDSALASGTTYYYQVIAFNAGGDSAAASSSGATYTELEAWRVNYFGTSANTGTAADTFDYEFDTLANLVEYGLGTDPTSAVGSEGTAASPTAALEVDGGLTYLTLTVVRSSRKTDITYQVEVSGGLSVWTNDVTILSDTDTLLKVRDNTPATSENSRFIRLEVTSP